MSWWDEDFFFGQYSDVSRVAETYQEETGVQSSEATNRPVLPDLNEEVAGQTSYCQFDLNQELCIDEDVNMECYADMSSSDEMEGLHDDLDVDQFDELLLHPWLQFPQGTVARNRCDRLLRKEMGQQKAIDYDLLAELGQLERMTTIIGEDTPWSRLFEMTYAPQYRLITMEFLSTFVYMSRGLDYQPQAVPQQSEISFRLCVFAYDLYLAEFGSALGLYTEQELEMPIYTTAIHTADDAIVSAWWPRIGDEPFVRAARVTRIRDPLIRYLHRCIASSVTGRGMSQEWCTFQNLFFLYCLLSGRPCNLARCQAEYFSTYYHRQERGLIYGGVYVTHMSSSDEMEGLHDDLDVDQFDALLLHPWLQFPQGTVARNRCDRLLRKEMGQQKAIDYDLLAELGQLQRMTAIIGEDTPWSRLFEMTYAPQYRLITMEFLSTFVYMSRGPDYQPQAVPQQSEISFRLCVFAYDLYLAEFGSALGLYTEQELEMPIYTTAIHTADDAIVSAWWPRIGDEPFVRAARVTRIRDPLIRYLHRCIASSVTGRGMSQEWCTFQNLFFLYCLLSGRPCNLARCQAEYFSTYYHRQERGLIYGGTLIFMGMFLYIFGCFG
ncbi:hypothetical protein R6Q57_001176 [Mikania cordata]